MENKTKFVSMFEITKMSFEGKNDFERQINYELYLKNKNEMEKMIMDDVNKKISIEIDKQVVDNLGIDLINSLKETAEKMKKIIENSKENFIDMPLKIYKSIWNDSLSLISFNDQSVNNDLNEEDEILYELYLSTDVKTGKLSIQYKGEDGSFLSHKEIIKGIKKENEIGKHWRV